MVTLYFILHSKGRWDVSGLPDYYLLDGGRAVTFTVRLPAIEYSRGYPPRHSGANDYRLIHNRADSHIDRKNSFAMARRLDRPTIKSITKGMK